MSPGGGEDEVMTGKSDLAIYTIYVRLFLFYKILYVMCAGGQWEHLALSCILYM